MNFEHHQHLSDAALRALLRRAYELAPEEGAHFLVCQTCQHRARELDREKAENVLRSLRPLSVLSDRLNRDGLRTLSRYLALLSQEVERAQHWIGRLASADAPEALLADVQLDPVALGTAVLRWSPEARQGDPWTLLRMCDLTLGHLHSSNRGESQVEIVAQLHAEKANAYRILGQFREAGRWMALAMEALPNCPDNLARGSILELASSYYIDTLDFERGRRCSLQAIELYRGLGRPENVERCQWHLALIPFMQGNLDTARRRFQDLLDGGLTDRVTELSTVSYLIRIHVMEGREFIAAKLLPRLRSLAAEWTHHDAAKAKINWLRGLIFGGIGEPDRGEMLLRRAYRYYGEQSIPFDAALAGVDLAYLLLRAGDHQGAAQVARESLELFRAEDTTYPQVYAAIRLVAETIRKERFSHALYREFSRFLELAQRDADLQFVPREGRET